MAKKIDIRDLYLSVVNAMDDANRQVEAPDEEREYGYAITDLEFSVPFQEMDIDDKGVVSLSLAESGAAPDSTRSLKFKVRFVPRPQKEEEKPPQTNLIMPDLVRKNAEEAVKIIQEVGLLVGNIHYNPMEKPYGLVLAQSPDPGVSVTTGQKVSLVISGVAPGSGDVKATDTSDKPPASEKESESSRSARIKKKDKK